ncbi:LEA type 2 family protein [Fulvivirgaceae bacterium BMA10]|uniref:LEA type 2 family protein n=1 Tax=Splendidivirga corallicola TaxID=3051826 RepID=A0ABT8KY37_9BACT|nr:LEA type 2 family protein [Fulvivirgaceae bacterium BMA10]
MSLIKRTIILALGPILFLSACGEYEAPEFHRIKNLKVHKVSGKIITLKGNALFTNPNSVGFKIKDIDIDLYIAEKNVAKITETSITKVPSDNNFEVPFEVNVPTKEIKGKVINQLLGMLGGQKMQIQFKGNIKFGKFGINKTTPVAHKDEIKLKI